MGTVLIVLFGILLPAATLGIELHTGMCAETFFDPIATIGHVLLVGFVPLANLLALVGSICHWTQYRKALLWANGIAMGIALVYTLVFLPIAPMAMIAVLCWGMGLLPLAPACSLLCAIALRSRLMSMPVADRAADAAVPVATASPSRGPLWGGCALGMLLVLLMEATVSITLIGAEMTASDVPGRRDRGVRILRRFGDRDELLRMCYRDGDPGAGGPFFFGSGAARSMSGFLFAGVPREDAQKLFFRVTGQSYNSMPPPRGVRGLVRDEFDFDPDVGGESVAGRRRGLSLESSRIDAKVEADAAVTYTEWTMLFRNAHSQRREARAQILLPPGGVVSRVTLWVDGEPREAAFAGVSQTRGAYKKVAVEQRRDPLLVTWAGVDRVLIQCFPVPPHGEMKIRLGITAPLLLTGPDTAALRLPCFAERNFNIATTDIHSVWIESDRSCKGVKGRLRDEKTGEEKYVVRGTLSDEALASAEGSILTTRSAEAAQSWTPDLKDPTKHVVQHVIAKRLSAKRQIVVVVDGSAGMAAEYDAIAHALASIGKDTDLRVFLAGDEVIDLSSAIADRLGNEAGTFAARLRATGGVGGCDNIPALLRAFEEAASGDKTIIWIHAVQPVLLQPAEPVVQWLKHGATVRLYDLAVAAGPNRVVDELKAIGDVQTVPRPGTLSDDLQGALAQLTGQTEQLRLERSVVEGEQPKTPKASSNLARLWAADQIGALARKGGTADRSQATKLAASYQLVTPVSGAVVLENQQQYKDANLTPADPDSGPIVPEPSSLVLLLTASSGLLWFVWRRWKRGNGR